VGERRKELTLRALFNEELGVVLQVPTAVRNEVMALLRRHGLSRHAHFIGKPNDRGVVEVWRDTKLQFGAPLAQLLSTWDEVSWRIARLRDHPECADAEHAVVASTDDPGLHVHLSFDAQENVEAPYVHAGRPRVAILREQGVNSHAEMAWAFDQAGFEAWDVHMSDLQAGHIGLDGFRGVVACGGFSYGDTLGAGEGWARSILFNPALRAEFEAFFGRADAFALGVCNGCQMMSQLAMMIPGAQCWPRFTRNRSEQFEGRLVMVEVLDSPSLFFAGMAGSRMPIANAHGEGYASFARPELRVQAESGNLVAVRYVDSEGRATERYPYNPNGSPGGITGLTTPDGRFTIMMPHPERVRRTVQRPHDTDAGARGATATHPVP
jgi:phosphoribosylformylglycinamidine synthase